MHTPQLYRIMDSTRDKFREVASCWIAPYFGVPLTPEQYGQAVNALKGTDTDWNAITQEKWFQSVQSVAHERRFFHWELEFPEVFFDAYGFKPKDEQGFDAIISNPPYIDIKGLEKNIVKYLFEAFDTTRLRINIFASFLERAFKVGSFQKGQIGFIIPTAFLTQESYANIRQLILENYWLGSVIRLPNELFGQAAGDVKVDTCIVIIHPDSKSHELITDVLIYDTFNRVNDISQNTASNAFKISQQRWKNRGDSIITLVKSKEDDTINRINDQSLPLDRHCEFCLGLTPYDKYTGHTQEQINNKVFHAKSQLDQTYKKLLVSGDVKRYVVEWNREEWIKYGDWLAAPREKRFFTQERILVQQIIDWTSLRILAGLTDEELYNTQNQFNLLSREGTNLKFIISILNSKLMSYYHRKVFLDTALQRFQKVLIKDAKTFPIRRIEFTTPSDERTQLLEEGKGLYEHYLSSGNIDHMMEFVQNQLGSGPCHSRENGNPCSNNKAFMDSHFRGNDNISSVPKTPERSDVIHDILAFLAEQMIDMNKQKQSEVKGFLIWFERTIGASVDGLKNKTKIQGYHDYGLNTIIDVLKQNKRNLSIDPNARNIQEQIEGEFNQSISKLTPLKQRITNTDRLIDQIVYRLYGLTDEEIAIVEETN